MPVPLDPQVQIILDQLAESGAPDLFKLTPVEARAQYAAFASLAPLEPVARTESVQIPVAGGVALTAHVFTPEAATGAVLVWLHGGGWVIGDLTTSDATATELANASGCTVVNVDYRLAPEHPFPTPLEDAYAAVRWVADHADELGVDPTRLALGGDSAGGNLTVATALLARERGGPDIRFQLLVYPALDARMSYPSIRENGKRLFLTADSMRWFWGHYLGDHDPEDPHASPLYADDAVLAGLPPALVITAEYDPLRDEGEAYSERLRQAGVDATTSRYDGQIHGFMGLSALLKDGRQAVDEAGAALRAALA
jgi:acetyl esterase